MLVNLSCSAIAWQAAVAVARVEGHPPLVSASQWHADGHAAYADAWAMPSAREAASHADTPAIDVPLNEGERRWLSTLPILRVGTDPTAAPLSLIGRDGEAEGLSIDYLQAALQALGVRSRTVTTVDWPETVSVASSGGVDLLAMASPRNGELGKHFVFSQPYAEFPVMIVTREAFPTIGDVHDLAGRRIAATLSQGAVAAAVAAIPGATAVDVRTTAAGLQAVATGDADAYVGDIATAELQIRRDYPARLKLAAPTNERAALTIAVARRYAPLVALIDRAMAHMPERRSQAIRNTWLRSQYTWGGSWKEVARKAAPAGAPVVLLLLAVSYAYLRLRRETRLRLLSEAQLADVTRHMPAVVYRFIYRPGGSIRFLYVGGNPEPIFGIDAATIMADERRAFARVDERDQPALLMAMAHSVATLEPLHAELRVRDSNPECWVASHALPREVPDGTEFTGYWIDISERHRQSAQLASAKRAAEAATQAKSLFLATMSHEIRTPMHGVLGTLEILGRTDLDPGQKHLLDTAETSAEALLQILDDILDFSRIEAGQVTIDPTPVDLRGLVAGIVDLFAWQARQKGLRISSDVDPRVAPSVLVDGSRLRQVIVNLVSNAVKFTERGGVELGVEVIEADDNRQRLCFRVTDTGIGIAEADMKRLFQPFSQAEASITRRFGGSGLGLAICRRLVELLGGHITMAGLPEGGTQVRVECVLPLAKTAARVATPESDTPATAAVARNVLVAEDHPINRELVAAQLERLGHRCRIAGDGATALAMATTWPVDVLLTDLHMPGMDGHALIRTLRERGATLRIVVMTADVMASERDRCMAAGADAFVTKPLRLAALRDAVAASIRVPVDRRDAWDIPLWQDMFGNLAAMPAMIDRFEADLDEAIDRLRAAATATTLADHLHRILGGMRVFGPSAAAAHIERLEARLRDASTRDDAMLQLAGTDDLLRDFVERLRTAVNDMLDK
jgi:two-component system sensor histidine kinase EvgS